MSRAEPVIEAAGVGKAFGRTRVLAHLDLRVGGGEALAVYGANGAGKSTLLRLCATLHRPTAGTLRLFGSEERGPAVRRRIGLVAHQSLCYPDLTARENLIFFARAYGVPAAEHVAADWLERVGLDDVANRPVRIFSRGMEQRLALARVLLHAPDLLLLDEPWTGLDAAAGDLLLAQLGALRREGRTIVVATHDVARGLAIADRVLVLHRGRVEWESAVGDDTPAALDAVTRRLHTPVAA